MKRGYIEDGVLVFWFTFMLTDGYLMRDYDDENIGPEFGAPLKNITVIQGREAVFTCTVRKLGQHKLAWLKADTKGVLAVHDKVLTNFGKLSVTHEDMHTWTLHIKDVQRVDRGDYMCQVNTNPVRAQTAHLEVVVPPDIIADAGGEVLVPEGGTAKLSCKARGTPRPQVQWRREDGKEIVVRGETGTKKKAIIFEGEVLQMFKVTRTDMGAYFCIANNGYPPPVSRRMVLTVHFPPAVHSTLQLVSAPAGREVTLECTVEASPRAVSYWSKNQGELILPGERIRSEETELNAYSVRLRLVIRRAGSSDFSGYKCAAKNSVGEAEAHIRLYEMKIETTKNAHLTTISTSIQTAEISEDSYDDFDEDRKEIPVRDVTPTPELPPANTQSYWESGFKKMGRSSGLILSSSYLLILLRLVLF